MLDISDYDLKLIHVPGKELAGPDALSRRPDLIPRENNDIEQITLLPKSLFVNTIDLAIADKIAKSSEKDLVVLKTLQAMDEDLLTQFRSWLSDWSYDAGILPYQGRIYIPDQDILRLDLVKKFHDHQTTGHPGYLKTKQLLTAGHWWPGMAQFIKKYVDGCTPCQQNKTNTHPTIPPLNPIISRETLPFKQISYNLITDLLVSNGFNSLLVMVDHGLSKGVILCPTKKTITTEGISTIIFRKLYTRFRLFNKIISDWGPQFAAKFQKELGRILRYKLALSLAYHPQTDGETKRVNQEIKTYLQIFCGSNSLEWTEQIPMAKFVHNRPHSVTGKSPFYLIMGYEPQALPDITNKTNLPAVEKRLDEIVKARNKASAAHKLARQTMKNWIQSKFTPFINGDKVWLEARNLRRNIVNPKFATKREGPFKITKVLSSLSYQLEIPKTWKIHLVFHASLLTPYKENNIHGPNYPQPPPDLINGEEEYEVEWILKHQGCPKHHQYLIRWKGYAANEDSWQSEANLRNASELLQEYKKRAKLL